MNPYFLQTKLQIPPESPRTVPRPRLTDPLEQEIANYKLVLVSAPAGYGKTSLLAQWARASRFPIVWLALGEEDNALDSFFQYLLAGWARVQPGVAESRLGLLLQAPAPVAQEILAAFINAAGDVPGDQVFVLDDYHLIHQPEIHQALTFLLDHLPPRVHFVLAGRADPPLPLARYRARHEVWDVRTEDLQFSPEETTAFLNAIMELGLTAEQITRLQEQLAGWIAGLQLASLGARRRGLPDPQVVSGRQRFIADYLRDEVLTPLPERVRRFLLQTSVVDQLCGSLCDALTDGQDGQATLEQLERDGLFLMALDDQREWFRYHPLFLDFLRAELTSPRPQEVPDLQRRAARWYLAHDLPEQAFDQALAGDDAALVSEIAERYILSKVMRGELGLVRRWLEAVPPAWYGSNPRLALASIAFLSYSGQIDASTRRLADVERLARAAGEEMRPLRAKVTAVHCFVACSRGDDLERVEALAAEALRELPEEDLTYRPRLYGSLGDTYRRFGHWTEARECYLKSLTFSHSQVVRVQSVHMFGALADLALRRGRPREAAAYWQQAQAVIEDQSSWGSYALPVTGWVYIRLAEILYEWNELGEAERQLTRGLERAELGDDVQTLLVGYLTGARLKLAQGDLDGAGGYFEQARALMDRAQFPDWAPRFQRLQVEYWIAQGRLRLAAEWAAAVLRQPNQADEEETPLAVARVLIAQGDSQALNRARALLQPVLARAEAEGRASTGIAVLALQALARWRHGDQGGALTALERALRLAEPEGYVRLFADLGQPMARLLQEACARNVAPDYCAQLLVAFAAGASVVAEVAKRALPEPLAPREQEVLQLLAVGLTNREIAEALVISPETVKKHTGSIYGKLRVRGRTEAVARARELDLLG